MTSHTYISPTKRRSMTKARATRIFLAADGVCHICTTRIRDGEPWEAEHVTALTLGGADTDDNLRPAHVRCHKAKTADDKRADAKRNRIIARGYAGKDKPRGRGFRKPAGSYFDWRQRRYVTTTTDKDAEAQRKVEG